MGRNWAITIGINGYRYLQRLDYAKQDANAVRRLFLQDLGFQQVYHFTDDSPDIPQDYGPDLESRPSATTLGRFLRTRFEKPFLRDGDNLWFFFAGHGIRSQNRDYLMPIDGDRGDLERSAIPIHYVSERLRCSGADNVILLIDACRSFEGCRDGVGIGLEKQQGVITLFSCSPEELAYEIAELQQGAFTHVLLESLLRQGEGNCATVERLYQQLRYYVPQLTRQYKRVPQTPYGIIEPPTKNHLILLPQRATLADIVTLKNDALRSEVQRDFKQAKQYWVRVLAASPADPEAIEGIERLSRGRPSQLPLPASPPSAPSPTASSQASPRLAVPVSSVSQPLSASAAPLQPLTQRSVGAGSKPFSSSGPSINRRTVLSYLTWFGGAMTVTLIVTTIQKFLPNTSDSSTSGDMPNTLSSTPNSDTDSLRETPSVSSLTTADFMSFEFEVVTVNETGEEVSRETQQGKVLREVIREVTLEMVAIPSGTFIMGSPENEAQRDNDEGPQHDVAVPQFLMGKYPVTQAQWRAVAALPKVERDLEVDPALFKGDSRPIEQISWNDAMEFCQRLSKQTGREYRLSSEVEWEYACRAGTITPFHFGPVITTDMANYNGNYAYGSGPKGEHRQQTTEAGSFPANAFGLYDMHGNVAEWCLDHWHDSYEGAPTDGSAWTIGGDDSLRMVRGGSWVNAPGYCRSADRYKNTRDYRNYGIGFRVVCTSSWILS